MINQYDVFYQNRSKIIEKNHSGEQCAKYLEQLKKYFLQLINQVSNISKGILDFSYFRLSCLRQLLVKKLAEDSSPIITNKAAFSA